MQETQLRSNYKAKASQACNMRLSSTGNNVIKLVLYEIFKGPRSEWLVFLLVVMVVGGSQWENG